MPNELQMDALREVANIGGGHAATALSRLMGGRRVHVELLRVWVRPAAEVTSLAGQPVAPAGCQAYNPAFDVTPPELISAVVTEQGVIQPVTAGNLRILGVGRGAVATPQATIYVER